jgi:hypothetical protein
MRFSKTLFAITLLLLLTACSSMPHQELSDARLTIRSAQDAGAKEYASESLSAAEILLQRATRLLEEQRYSEARKSAIQARERASSAREIALLRAAEEADQKKSDSER